MESRVKAPAIALAIAGGMSLVLALFGLGFALLTWMEPQAIPVDFGGIEDRDVRELVERFFEVMHGPVGVVLSLAQVLATVFVLVAALQMARLRSWGLAVAASVIAVVPCVLPCYCCCVNFPIAVWCLAVLFQADVRQAFRSGAPPAAQP